MLRSASGGSRERGPEEAEGQGARRGSTQRKRNTSSSRWAGAGREGAAGAGGGRGEGGGQYEAEGGVGDGGSMLRSAGAESSREGGRCRQVLLWSGRERHRRVRGVRFVVRDGVGAPRRECGCVEGRAACRGIRGVRMASLVDGGGSMQAGD